MFGSSTRGSLAVFWDYASCQVPSNAGDVDIRRMILDTLKKRLGSFDVEFFRAWVCSNDVDYSILSQQVGIQIVKIKEEKKTSCDSNMISCMLSWALVKNSCDKICVLIGGNSDFVYSIQYLSEVGVNTILFARENTSVALKDASNECFSFEKLLTEAERVVPNPVKVAPDVKTLLEKRMSEISSVAELDQMVRWFNIQTRTLRGYLTSRQNSEVVNKFEMLQKALTQKQPMLSCELGEVLNRQFKRFGYYRLKDYIQAAKRKGLVSVEDMPNGEYSISLLEGKFQSLMEAVRSGCVLSTDLERRIDIADFGYSNFKKYISDAIKCGLVKITEFGDNVFQVESIA